MPHTPTHTDLQIPQEIIDFQSQFPTGPAVLQKTRSEISQVQNIAGSDIALELQRNLEDIIGQGGVGLSQEQLDVQFRGIEQSLRPQFQEQIQRIDEQAARRGVFRSGIPLEQAQQTQRQQSQQLANVRIQMQTENERLKNQTLLTALQMLQSLEADMASRIAFMRALQQQKEAQNQAGFQNLLGQGLSFGLDLLFPGAGRAAEATGILPGGTPASSPAAPFPTTGGIT